MFERKGIKKAGSMVGANREGGVGGQFGRPAADIYEYDQVERGERREFDRLLYQALRGATGTVQGARKETVNPIAGVEGTGTAMDAQARLACK